jgi:hypothetical protein
MNLHQQVKETKEDDRELTHTDVASTTNPKTPPPIRNAYTLCNSRRVLHLDDFVLSPQLLIFW